MIIVHGMIPIKPEQRDRVLELARRMGTATRLEPGCISYDFYIGLADPNTLLLFQEWETMDALSAHFQTDHMDHFMRELPECLDGQITTRRFAVPSGEEENDDGRDQIEVRVDDDPVIH
ncbi:MAG: putative quinol monooxygenase [Pseudomonadota bacterium]